MQLPDYVKILLDTLNSAGYHTAAVGGCVRDPFLRKNPDDYDLTTAAPWQKVKELLSPRFPVLETGIKHGTVTVLSDSHPVEITTFRIESGYSDARHPDAVTFTDDLTADLARRDFTVNAMAYDGKMLFDPFCGRQDIERKIIRCVGDADTRFCEDALRILRALRFASKLGFSIEENTAAALRRHKDKLCAVSAERKFTELKKLLIGKDAGRILREFPEVIGAAVPEILPLIGLSQDNPHHIYDAWVHTAYAVDAVKPEVHLRLAALLHDTGKADVKTVDQNGIGHFYEHGHFSEQHAREALLRLKSDRKTLDTVTKLVKHHDIPLQNDRAILLRRLRQFGKEMLFDLIELQKADAQAQAFHPGRLEMLDEIRAACEELIKEQVCFSLSDLAVNGSDLIAAGIPAGKRIGEALELLLGAVCEGKVKNEKGALLEWIKEGPKR